MAQVSVENTVLQRTSMAEEAEQIPLHARPVCGTRRPSSQTTVNKADYAVAVIGGPAGAVAAYVLARAGIDVRLVDARPPTGLRGREPGPGGLVISYWNWGCGSDSSAAVTYLAMGMWPPGAALSSWRWILFARPMVTVGISTGHASIHAARYGRRSGRHHLQFKTDLVRAP